MKKTYTLRWWGAPFLWPAYGAVALATGLAFVGGALAYLVGALRSETRA